MALPARVGRYEIEIVIGQGPLGRVFLARDPRLGRPVAIKALRDDLGLTADLYATLADQFRRAASAAAALSHPAIATLHDMGEEESVGVYLVSELVKGPTLHERITRGRLLRSEVATLARTLGSALANAHAAGVVHGDIKPENVMLSPSGAKLVDFGFPVSVPPTSESPAEGALPAAPRPYAAPEILAGGGPSARADQFSLAVSLYEAMTGRLPLAGAAGLTASGSSPAASSGAMRARSPSSLLPELRGAGHLDAIFDCALATDPRRRFPSCETFTSTLADVLDAAQSTLPTPPTSQSSIVPRATRRWQNAVAGAAVLVIFALVALGGRRHAASDGVSLKSVAGAFSEAVAAPRLRPTSVAAATRGDVHSVSAGSASSFSTVTGGAAGSATAAASALRLPPDPASGGVDASSRTAPPKEPTGGSEDEVIRK